MRLWGSRVPAQRVMVRAPSLCGAEASPGNLEVEKRRMFYAENFRRLMQIAP
jgi:hypothetical protein